MPLFAIAFLIASTVVLVRYATISRTNARFLVESAMEIPSIVDLINYYADRAPALAEAGMPQFDRYTWFGMFAPAGTLVPRSSQTGVASDSASAAQSRRATGSPSNVGTTSPCRSTATASTIPRS